MNTTRHPTRRKLLALGTGVGLAVAAVPLGGMALAANGAVQTAEDAAPLTTADLVEMREEERLAGDVYESLAESTGQIVFSRIGASEDRHQAAVERLLAIEGVDIASLPDTVGDYRVDAYDDLYEEYVAADTLDEALQAGIEIEERDIADLEGLLERDLTAAQERVATALLNASEHHLAAFTALAEGDVPDGAYGPGAGHGPMAGHGPGARGGNGPGFGPGERGNGYGMSRGHGLGNGAGPGAGFGDCPYADEG